MTRTKVVSGPVSGPLVVQPVNVGPVRPALVHPLGGKVPPRPVPGMSDGRSNE